MSQDVKSVLAEARRWIEQERVWDDSLYAGAQQCAPTVSHQKEPVGVDRCRPAIALQALYEQYKACQACPLGATRIQFVFGVGNPDATVMFIGEGPGYEEDRKGEPFVGKAGQLLDKIMASIGLDRQNSYIANIVKCHPMQNPETPEARGNDRPPNAVEVETCSPILAKQIAIIQPKFIVTLGSPSSKAILQTTEGITKLRGQLFPFPGNPAIQVLPTYHPAALLRSPDLKKDTWTDMKLLRDQLRK